MFRLVALPLLVVAALLAPAPADDPAVAGVIEPERAALATPAELALARMSLPQQVGQLFMVGTPADRADRRTRAQVVRRHVGSVMLTGRSHGGTRQPARVAAAMRSAVSPRSTADVGLFVATDQEGGQVRVLQGRGFSPMPSALVQGRWRPTRLRAEAARWARELRRAGVDLDLAPVLDTVPGRRAARANPPIGAFDRELGYTPSRVASRGVAFARGMRDGQVSTAVKHFPGLGRVRANTDTATGVVDRVTRRHDRYLAPFRAAVADGAPFVMMSSARYLRLDPEHAAAFSPYVVTTMLRGDLGFTGVVISDDLANARQVAHVRPGQRALRFLRAGGDMVLTVDPRPLPEMYAAVLRQARTSAAFRERVRQSALRVLVAKQERGLL